MPLPGPGWCNAHMTATTSALVDDHGSAPSAVDSAQAWVSGVDGRVMDWVVARRTGVGDAAAGAVMNVGGSYVTWIIVVAIAALLAVRARRLVLLAALVVSAPAAYLLATALKEVIARPRPPAADALATSGTWSMPSSTAAFVIAPCLALLVGLGHRVGALAAVVMVAANLVLGWAVVYLGAHWPSDVVAGWALGAVVGAALGVVGRIGRHEAR